MSAVPPDFDVTELRKSNKEGLDKIKFSEDLCKDPVEKPRKCTDVLCCLVFTATFVGMFVCSIIGYSSGDPWKLMAPIDGNGNICGYT